MAYAEKTAVSVEASRNEIERTLARYKADAFAYATDGCKATLMFRMAGRHVRFQLTLPAPDADEFWIYKRGHTKYRRVDAEGQRLYEQACRQKWRALALVIKAKLEAVSAGITTVEDEFLAHTLLPDGSTMGQWAKPQIDEAYRIGSMPRGLLALEGPRG